MTILTADLLLINAKLARAVVDRAGLRPDQVYFTSSHTHGGPGGWGDHPLEMLVAGAYDPAYFEIAGGSARRRRRAVEGRTRAGRDWASSRSRRGAGRGIGSTRACRPTTRSRAWSSAPSAAPSDAAPLAILVVFGAHATVSHPVPPRLGGDYPAALASELKRRTGARAVLFASGAVGDASPSPPEGGLAIEERRGPGRRPGRRPDGRPALRPLRPGRGGGEPPARRRPAPGPPAVLRAGAPVQPAADLVDRRPTDAPARAPARPGGPGRVPRRLLGPPGRPARRRRPGGPALSTVATSFDGDFRGYLVSEDVFRRKSCYETRWMSFYGPWTGEYLNDLARRMVERLSTGPTAGTRPGPASMPTSPPGSRWRPCWRRPGSSGGGGSRRSGGSPAGRASSWSRDRVGGGAGLPGRPGPGRLGEVRAPRLAQAGRAPDRPRRPGRLGSPRIGKDRPALRGVVRPAGGELGRGPDGLEGLGEGRARQHPAHCPTRRGPARKGS